MFVDACALVSLIAGEETGASYEEALDRADGPWTSALAAWEAIMVLSGQDQLDCRFSEAEGAVAEWLEARNIALREGGRPREVLGFAVAAAELMASGSARSATSTASIMPTRRRLARRS